jgi:hypothetical protein
MDEFTVEDVIRRLTRERDEIIRRVGDIESVGNGIPIVLLPELASRHSIQPLGRMTVVRGKTGLRFAPKDIDRTPCYDTIDRDMFAMVDAHVAGKHVEVPQYMFEECPVPEMRVVDSKDARLVERALFDHLQASSTHITLVNPAFSTMTSALGKGAQIYLTDTKDRVWKDSVYDFVSKSKNRISMSQGTIPGVAYLGSRTPTHYRGEKWCYFIPNPYESADLDGFEMSQRLDGISFAHYRDGARVVCDLSDAADVIVYSPSTVKANFGSSRYILVSNTDLSLAPGDDAAPVHSPWFVDKWPDLEDVNGMFIRRDGNVLYDIDGPGTYVSRRTLAPPDGYRWASLSQVGKFGFDRFSNVPVLYGGIETAVITVGERDLPILTYGDDIKVALQCRVSLGGDLQAYDKKLLKYVACHHDPNGAWYLCAGMIVKSDEVYRETHAFYEDHRAGYSGLVRGTWMPLQSFYHDGCLHVMLDGVHDNVSRVVIFRDEKHRKRYYMQYGLSSIYWSRINKGMQIDDNLVAASEKKLTSRLVDELQASKAPRTIGQLSLVLDTPLHQLMSAVTYLRGTVVMTKTGDTVRQIPLQLMEHYDDVLPGDTYDGGKSVRGVYEQLRVTRAVRVRLKAPRAVVARVVSGFRQNSMIVNVVESRDERGMFELYISK